MVDAALDLDQWLKRVQKAKSRLEIFKLLDQFRPLAWTDDERAAMGKTYIRQLEVMKDPDDPDHPDHRDQSGPSGQEAADGPVWYEKM